MSTSPSQYGELVEFLYVLLVYGLVASGRQFPRNLSSGDQFHSTTSGSYKDSRNIKLDG